MRYGDSNTICAKWLALIFEKGVDKPSPEYQSTLNFAVRALIPGVFRIILPANLNTAPNTKFAYKL